MKVFKFGGSSLATPEGFKNCAELIKKQKNVIVVLSAIGKVNKQDIKVTDLLYDICLKKKRNKQYKEEVLILRQKFFYLAKELKILNSFYAAFNHFIQTIPLLEDNYLISRGEYFTALLMHKYTKIEFIDSRVLFKFKSNGCLNEQLSYKCFCSINKNKFITSGFYGEYESGKIALFQRGGGDISGAYLAAFSKSKAYFNFTDVNGIYNNPPSFFNKQTIDNINYSDALYLTQNGANVLCDAAVPVLFRFKVPTYIINSKSINQNNTLVCNCEKPAKTNCLMQNKNCFITKISILKKHQNSLCLYTILKIIMSNKIKLLYVKLEKNTIVIISDKRIFLEKYLNKTYIQKQRQITQSTFLFTDATTPNKTTKKIITLFPYANLYLRLSISGKRLVVFSYDDSEKFCQRILDFFNNKKLTDI